VDEYMVGDYVEEWDVSGLLTQLAQLYPVAVEEDDVDPQAVDKAALLEDLQDDIVQAYVEREEELGPELMRELERYILLRIIDERWREHLHDMDYLREGIHLRGFAQIDPLVAYKNEGFSMFEGLMNAIWEEFARYVFHAEVRVEGEDLAGNGAAAQPARNVQYSGGTASDQPSALAAAAAAGTAGAVEGLEDEAEVATATIEPHRLDENEKIGRNDPCWCGSGKKFKKCHGAAA
jgi:preprotein translocase subunit SecA